MKVTYTYSQNNYQGTCDIVANNYTLPQIAKKQLN